MAESNGAQGNARATQGNQLLVAGSVSSLNTTLGHENNHKLPVIFTGPSGLRDHRAHRTDFPHAVGTGTRSRETTSDVSYLTRQAPNSSFPLVKHGRSGEIGWPAETFQCIKGL